MARLQMQQGKGAVRFLYFFNYPKDVAVEDCERWFFSEHAPSVAKLKGLQSFRSWKGLPPIRMGTYDPWDRFNRLAELVFDNYDNCIDGTINNGGLWQSATEGQTGFREVECICVDDVPQYDLLKEIPVQQFKYINNPPEFTGDEDFDESDDTFIDLYMFNYRVPNADGEDWYLGHHVREGRITKRLGNRHYQTWKSHNVPEVEGSPLKPNRFYRITELGLPDWSRGIKRPGGNPRSFIKFTRSPVGEVIGEWRNILIEPGDFDDLLA